MKSTRNFWLTLIMAISLLFVNTGYVFAGDEETVRVIISFDNKQYQKIELESGSYDFTSSNYLNSEKFLVKTLGGKIEKQYHVLPAVSADIPISKINELKALSNVVSVEIDPPVYLLDQVVPWGIQKEKADQVFSISKGKGVKIGVIDTGIDLDHPDLKVVGNKSFLSGVKSGDDDNGHGTHVAGTIAALNNSLGVVGVAPEADLYALKVLDRTGNGYLSDVISAIEWAVDNDLDIVNLSLGTQSGYYAFQSTCDNAYNKGLLIVAAAGNSGTAGSTSDCVGYPAKYESVIAVGAIGSNNSRANFSSTGPAVEFAAPGVSIYSTYKEGSYGYMSGTSMAAPHVTGLAALVCASSINDSNKNGRINDEVRKRMQESTLDLGKSGRDVEYGYGLLDATRAVYSYEGGNRSPVANAGADRTVSVDSLVTLTGSSSYDPDGDILNYNWSQVDGAPVYLSNCSSVQCTFSTKSAGKYTFQLIVNDGKLDSAPDQVVITVKAVNTLPTAPVIAISPGLPLTSDNLVCNIVNPSTDVNSDPINYSYAWYKNGVLQSRLKTNTVAASLTSKGNTWRCKVTPNDGFGNGPYALNEVKIGNTAPVASAGTDQNVIVRKVVTLNGTGSKDADRDSLTYKWVQKGGPKVALSKSTTSKSTFTPAAVGTYVFQLTVSDKTASSSDEVSVIVAASVLKKMYIDSITMSLSKLKNGASTSANAKVIIKDETGKVVSSVKVKGHWQAGTTVYKYSSTTSTSYASFKSAALKYPASGTVFTFYVDDLTKTGWTYSPSSNKINSASVSVP